MNEEIQINDNRIIIKSHTQEKNYKYIIKNYLYTRFHRHTHLVIHAPIFVWSFSSNCFHVPGSNGSSLFRRDVIFFRMKSLYLTSRWPQECIESLPRKNWNKISQGKSKTFTIHLNQIALKIFCEIFNYVLQPFDIGSKDFSLFFSIKIINFDLIAVTENT